MMDGCQRARNPHGFKMVWDKLVKAGLKLDTAIWTARISGLIALGEPDEEPQGSRKHGKTMARKGVSGQPTDCRETVD